VSFQVGDTVGAYKIVELIGTGGAGQVFKAAHTITKRIEALKVLSATSREQAPRFLREIQIQASLSHPNIAAVHNAFWVGDELVMAVEFVEGEALSRILERGRMPLATALAYAEQALAALEHAHAHKVTHRDVTPGNLLVTANGQVKVTDFGLAKSPADLRLTQTGALLGSVYYMSPEQVRADPALDLRSDIYSMGAVLYEMASGAKPFDGQNAFEIMSAHVSREPRAPAVVDAALPGALSEIILKALAKDPQGRFQSAGAFRLALQGVGRSPVKKKAVGRAALGWAITGAAALGIVLAFYSGAPKAAVPEPASVALPARPVEPKPELPAPVVHGVSAGAAVWALALSPSGRWLAAGTEGGTIEVWDVQTGGKRATLRGHSAGVTAVCFSRDENTLASGDADRQAKVWDLRTKAERDQFRTGAIVTAVALSPNGKWLAVGSSDKKVKLWNLRDGRQSAGFREKRAPSALAFSANGERLAVAHERGLQLWSVNDPRKVQSFDRPGAGALIFAPDGHCLALTASPGALKLWDTAGTRQVGAVASHGAVRTVAISQHGRIAAAGGEGRSISIWKMGR
jgi:Protein kinase domain/WD domain, G-beta repeat